MYYENVKNKGQGKVHIEELQPIIVIIFLIL